MDDKDIFLLYGEMHDGLVHLEIACTACNSIVNIPVPQHLVSQLATILPKEKE